MRDVRGELASAVTEALSRAGLPQATVILERPARLEHGEWSTNVALTLAREVGEAPRGIAERLREALEAQLPTDVSGVEVAGPGFVNFRLAPSWLHSVLADVVAEGTEHFGRSDLGGGESVQIEFVSANPTGPLHVGNGWLGSYGDALGRVMERCGWRVSREYYVNDTGGQIRALGASLLAVAGGGEVPEGGYRGAYVADLAAEYSGGAVAPDRRTDEPSAEEVTKAGRFAAERILGQIRSTLDDLGIVYDQWYSQAAIEEGGALEETIAIYTQRGLCYEKDGALMLRTTEFGDGRDRVLRKSQDKGGDFTYLAGDLAYHRDKFLVRGFDRVIDVFGADHHGQVASLRAGVAALGVDPSRLEIRLGQLVSVAEGGEAVRMSKRSGQFVALHELVEDLGPAVTRLLSLVSSIDQATTVDLSVVKAQSAESPVYYVQYAHARLASIERVAVARGIERLPLDRVDLSLIVHPRELDVLRALAQLPDTIELAATERAPHRITAWVRDFASRFHSMYHECRVMGDTVQPELTQARLWVVEASKIGLRVALALLGVDAPESMRPSGLPAEDAVDDELPDQPGVDQGSEIPAETSGRVTGGPTGT